VKNVGKAPVDVIMAARAEEGPFQDINDFSHRVDLRHVGKRALECLIRVGALDRFGDRPGLLHSIDRLASFSAAHFRAVEIGQMTLFGPDTGLQEEFIPSQSASEVSYREQLNWERELIGLYVSDHPLNPVMDILTDIVTHFSGQLNEADPKDKVRLAGMITRYRTHQTRKGQSMAFATLEDIQGEVELVIFPRPWRQIQNLIQVDKLVLVEGRIDPESSEPKLLVDSIKTDLTITRPAASEPAPNPPPPVTAGEPHGEVEPETSGVIDKDPAVDPDSIQEDTSPYSIPEPEFVSDQDQEMLKDIGQDHVSQAGIPPVPENFPEDWELTSAIMSAVADPETAIDLAETAGRAAADAAAPVSPAAVTTPESQLAGTQPEAGSDSSKGTSEIPREIGLDPLPAYLGAPGAAPDSDKVKMITIVLRSSQDKVRDNLRIRQIYGTLITYPGKDRFAFHVFERSHGYLIEFPNFTTHVCPELLSRLKTFIHVGEVRVEEITFQ
jgi:DNA polymerase-3 subunit alpha